MAEKTVRVEGTVSVGSDTGLIVLNADKSSLAPMLSPLREPSFTSSP